MRRTPSVSPYDVSRAVFSPRVVRRGAFLWSGLKNAWQARQSVSGAIVRGGQKTEMRRLGALLSRAEGFPFRAYARALVQIPHK